MTMPKYHVFYRELMCLCGIITRLNSKALLILSYVENFFNIIWYFLLIGGGALFMHILHSEKMEQPIEKLSESFLDLSLNWASVGELKKQWSVSSNRQFYVLYAKIHRLYVLKIWIFRINFLIFSWNKFIN